MPKVNLTNPASFVNDASAAAQGANNNAAIQAAFENTLSRDGTGPNSMGADLDMNSHRIFNLPVPMLPSDPARLQDLNLISPSSFFTQTGTGAVPRLVSSKLTETVSVRDFGAVGNGVTDDSAAIQKAVSALLAAGGGRLYVPGSTGDYICNNVIFIDARLAAGRYGGAMQIVGDGPSRSCFRSTTLNAAMFAYIGDLLHDESHFRLENIRLSGNIGAPVTSSQGISLSAGAWTTFDRCDVEGFDTGIGMADVDQIAFYNCNIRFNNRGIVVSTGVPITSPNSWLFVNTLIAGNATYGMYIKNANAFAFIGGSVQYNGRIGVGGGWGVYLDEVGDGYGNILFSGMAFEGNGGLADFMSSQTINPANITFNSVGFSRTANHPVVSVTGAQGSVTPTTGLIRLQVASTAGLSTGQVMFVSGVGGVTAATGQWTITVFDATHIDLQGSTFSGTYTSGGIMTFYGYGTNQIYIDGTNANTTYNISGSAFRSFAPYVPSASRPSIALSNTSAKIIDNGSNYFQNAVEKLTYPDAQLVSLGVKNGAWVATTPTVTVAGTAGTFAATCVMKTLQVGKLVTVQMIVTVSNIGTATGFKVAFPVTPKQSLFMTGGADSAAGYTWFSGSGQMFKYDGTATPVVQNYFFNGAYEAA